MPCALHAVGVDRNEQVLYAGGADGRIFAKDLVVPAGVATAEHPLGAELSEELPGHSQAVTGIEFGPEGLHMFSGSLDGQVRMWDMESHQTLRTFDLQSPVACIRVFPRADFDRGAQQVGATHWKRGGPPGTDSADLGRPPCPAGRRGPEGWPAAGAAAEEVRGGRGW